VDLKVIVLFFTLNRPLQYHHRDFLRGDKETTSRSVRKVEFAIISFGSVRSQTDKSSVKLHYHMVLGVTVTLSTSAEREVWHTQTHTLTTCTLSNYSLRYRLASWCRLLGYLNMLFQEHRINIIEKNENMIMNDENIFTSILTLNLSGNYMYHLLQHSITLYFSPQSEFMGFV
jgi:hypothetical protein